MSLYFDDLNVGDCFTSSGRTITESDLTLFAMLSGDWNPIHTDAEFARNSRAGQRIVHGVLGVAVLTGLMDRAGWFSESAVAMLSLDDWTFHGPIRIGDTLHCDMEITATRLTSSGTAGVVGRRFSLVNQNDLTVQSGECPGLIAVKPTSNNIHGPGE